MLNHIVFKSQRIVAAPKLKPMRVRGGKVGKVKTELDVIAAAERQHQFGKVMKELISNAHLFKAFDKQQDSKGHWVATKTLAVNRKVEKVASIAYVSEAECDVTNTNAMLRRILAFKGYHIEELQEEFSGFETTRANKLDKTAILHGRTKERINELMALGHDDKYKEIVELQKRLDNLGHIKGKWKKCKPFVMCRVSTDVSQDVTGKNIAANVITQGDRIKGFHVGTIKIKNIFPITCCVYKEPRVIGHNIFFDGKSCSLITNGFAMMRFGVPIKIN